MTCEEGVSNLELPLRFEIFGRTLRIIQSFGVEGSLFPRDSEIFQEFRPYNRLEIRAISRCLRAQDSVPVFEVLAI